MTNIFIAYPSKLKDLVIFSDCQSVLQAAEHQDIKIRQIKSLLWKINSFLNTFAVKLTLQWIPSHNNKEGNIKADILAKQGATYTQHDTPASYDTA
jgi:ribonuclease HI